ncbi:EF-hand domain-containing protein [Sphingomonas hankookensis]|uniref:EF-hand domain-containing protein n=1 Tax=Sphingomonas hengshuiensis TaxID=1609977 RepID=A0A2W4Z955_9SPHN|nr:MAG: hypothetical protein DI632_06090 [Sphingomonas hengshuiensis]
MRLPILCAIVSAGIATPAAAQRGGGDWFAAADTDRDSVVTRAEFLRHRDASFTRLDRNGDGVVSPADFPRLARRKPDALDRLMAALDGADTNGDGAISRGELGAAPPWMFDLADANRDGRVTRAEYDAARARRKDAIDRRRGGGK